MAYSVKNSLFVRNLSPNVTESILREVFGSCDEIENVLFRAFNNKDNQFFAQIDFKTSKGVTEGTKFNGTAIMGTACLVGVIDPLAGKQQQDAELAKLREKPKIPGDPTASAIFGEGQSEPQGVQAEYFKRQKEEMDDQQFRTCHLTGFKTGVTEEALKLFCEHFGEVIACKVDEPEGLAPFALVEFAERGPAHVVKTQKSYEVDGRIIQFTESKTMVNAVQFQEKTVHFQQPIFDFMNMKAVLSQQAHLTSKLAQVREAAMSIKIGEKDDEDDDKPLEWDDKKDEADKKEKKEKKDKKDKKVEKEDKQKEERQRLRSRSRSPLKRSIKTKEGQDKLDSKDRKDKEKEKEKEKEKDESDDDIPDKEELKKLAKKMLKEEKKQKKKEKKEKKKKEKLKLLQAQEEQAEASQESDSFTGKEEEPAPAKKVKLKKKKDVAEDETSESGSPKKPAKTEKKVKQAKEKKKTGKMALETEDQEEDASEDSAVLKKPPKKEKKEKKVKNAKEKKRKKKDQEDDASEDQPSPKKKVRKHKEEGDADGESSSDMIDLDDEVDVVPNTETVVLGMASSSSSSSSSKSSVDPDELEVLPDPDAVEMTGETKDDPVEFMKRVPKRDQHDAVEFMKRVRLPMGSPAMTTPGDISSTDSSDSSSDSPVREIAGEVSDGEGTGSTRRRHACIVPMRRRAGPRRMPKIIATAAVPIGLDEVGDGGDVASDDDVVLD